MLAERLKRQDSATGVALLPVRLRVLGSDPEEPEPKPLGLQRLVLPEFSWPVGKGQIGPSAMHISATLTRPLGAKKSAFRIEQLLSYPDVIQRVTLQADEPNKSVMDGNALNARDSCAIDRPSSCHIVVRKLRDS
jgi:hypothetical protein